MPSLSTPIARRSFLAGTAAAALTGGVGQAARAGQNGPDAGFQFAVTKSPDEWRSVLSEDEFGILRDAKTEFPTTSSYWNTNSPGTYHCRGCQQALYSSDDYSPQQVGFVFFRHSLPMSVILSKHSTDYNGAFPEPRDYIQSICSNCGGHLGHIVVIDGEALHCINGTVLDLHEKSA